MTQADDVTRRRVLGGLGVLGLTVATGRGVRAAPAAAAEPALGVQEKVDDGLRRLFGTRPIKDGRGTVQLDIAHIAENGAMVPVGVDVTSPMTPADHVRRIYVVADRNRIPIVTRVALTPAAGQARIGASIRLGETTTVRAIVERSDGTLLQVTREVKVTVGGCGG
jgi:sulfur-oxidizing protein SoxY